MTGYWLQSSLGGRRRGVSHWPAGGRVAMQTGDVTKKVHTSGWVLGLGGKLNHISLYCIVAIAAQHVTTSPSARQYNGEYK